MRRTGKRDGIKPGREMVMAKIKGGPLAPDLRGTVKFSGYKGGTMVAVEVKGLPPYSPGYDDVRPIGPHGFHIHDQGICEIGDPDNPFMLTGGHWNPTDQPHGNHAGDFPVLFSNHGVAKMKFFTDKFRPADVIGRSVVIHQNPDDYQSQPAGNSGKKLACGVIGVVRETKAQERSLGRPHTAKQKRGRNRVL